MLMNKNPERNRNIFKEEMEINKGRCKILLLGPPSWVTASTNRSCRSAVQRRRGLGSEVKTRQGSPRPPFCLRLLSISSWWLWRRWAWSLGWYMPFFFFTLTSVTSLSPPNPPISLFSQLKKKKQLCYCCALPTDDCKPQEEKENKGIEPNG